MSKCLICSQSALRTRALKTDSLGSNPSFAIYLLWDLSPFSVPHLKKEDRDSTNILRLLGEFKTVSMEALRAT